LTNLTQKKLSWYEMWQSRLLCYQSLNTLFGVQNREDSFSGEPRQEKQGQYLFSKYFDFFRAFQFYRGKEDGSRFPWKY